MKLAPVTPDWPGLLHNLQRRGTPERVFYFEHGIADNVAQGIAGGLGLWDDVAGTWLDRTLAVHRFLGIELFRIFPSGARLSIPTEHGWTNEDSGPIPNLAACEAFAWPDPAAADLTVMDQLERRRPENMRAFHVLDIWEKVRDLIGFTRFCYAIYEEPELIDAVFDRAGTFAVAIAEALCDYDSFGAVYLADDLGYKTSTMIAPEHVQRWILPWHRRLAEVAHAHGKLLLFHSCGQMYDLIDTYIDDVGIDAKHSFEDAVVPVTEAKRRWGDRLSLLGGIDVDFLARADEAAIRQRTREVLDICHTGGGYCLGSGNWVTNYIPVDNYLAMLDEARKWSA